MCHSIILFLLLSKLRFKNYSFPFHCSSASCPSNFSLFSEMLWFILLHFSTTGFSCLVTLPFLAALHLPVSPTVSLPSLAICYPPSSILHLPVSLNLLLHPFLQYFPSLDLSMPLSPQNIHSLPSLSWNLLHFLVHLQFCH